MAAAAPDYQRIGAAFVAHYYNLFDTSRPALAPLYVRSPPRYPRVQRGGFERVGSMGGWPFMTTRSSWLTVYRLHCLASRLYGRLPRACRRLAYPLSCPAFVLFVLIRPSSSPRP